MQPQQLSDTSIQLTDEEWKVDMMKTNEFRKFVIKKMFSKLIHIHKDDIDILVVEQKLFAEAQTKADYIQRLQMFYLDELSKQHLHQNQISSSQSIQSQQQSSIKIDQSQTTMNQQKSVSNLLICDYCNDILDTPILILCCERTICKFHYQADKKCHFCNETYEKPFTELKKLKLLADKFKNAKMSCVETSNAIKQLESLQTNSSGFIENYFKKIQETIINDKEKLLKEFKNVIENKFLKIMNDINELFKECQTASKQISITNLNDLKLKVDTWLKDFDLSREIKVSESVWELTTNESAMLKQEIFAKTDQLKNELILNKNIKFIPYSHEKIFESFNVGEIQITDNSNALKDNISSNQSEITNTKLPNSSSTNSNISSSKINSSVNTILSKIASNSQKPTINYDAIYILYKQIEKREQNLSSLSPKKLCEKLLEKKIEVDETTVMNFLELLNSKKFEHITEQSCQTEIHDIRCDNIKKNNQQHAMPDVTLNLASKKPQSNAANVVKEEPIDVQSSQPGIKIKIRLASEMPTTSKETLNKHDKILLKPHEPTLEEKPKVYCRILGHINYVFCVCFDRSGQYIFTGSDDKLIKIWRASDGLLVATLRGNSKEISDMDLNFENTLFASAGYDRKVKIWNLKTTELIENFSDHISLITSVKFSPFARQNCRWMVSSGQDGQVNFYKYDIKSLIFEYPSKFREDSKISSISFSCGGSLLIASCEHKIVIFHLNHIKPSLLERIDTLSTKINTVQFANKSFKFISGGKGGYFQIWNRENKKWSSIDVDTSFSRSVDSNNHLTNSSFEVTFIVWNCDDSLCITTQICNSIRSIKVWNALNGSLTYEFNNVHTNNVFVLESHPTNPNLLASASHDGYVKLWNLKDGCMIEKFYNQIGTENLHGGIYDLKWSPLLNMFAACDSHGHLIIYGYGDNEKSYEIVPKDQFFHNDYRPTIRKQNQLIDKKTGLVSHLMPPPFLMSSLIVPYELKYQKMIKGRENMTEDQLAISTLKENGQYDMIDEFELNNPNLNSNPVQIHRYTDDEIAKWTVDLIQPLDAQKLKSDEQNRSNYLSYEELYFETSSYDSSSDRESDIFNERKKRDRRRHISDDSDTNEPQTKKSEANSNLNRQENDNKLINEKRFKLEMNR